MPNHKHVIGIYRSQSAHWVGDGFPVRNFFPSNDLGEGISPFLLLDYAAPYTFPPTDRPRGVGEHPHRGFETVTIVYQGELEHRDSGGNHGVLAPGDVQWMTAAAGVVHEEKHERNFAKHGGTIEMVQLWVNLPKADKMSPPRYQTLAKAQIPEVSLGNDQSYVRIVAGEFHGVTGPAATFSPINLYDVRLAAGHAAEFNLPAGFNTAIFVLSGKLSLNAVQTVQGAELALFSGDDEAIAATAENDSIFLVLNGEAIREPVARRGPFVMNTDEEIAQAFADYQAGKMGHLN